MSYGCVEISGTIELAFDRFCCRHRLSAQTADFPYCSTARRKQFARQTKRVFVIVSRKMRHAGFGVVRHRAAEFVFGNFFVRNGFYHVRSG